MKKHLLILTLFLTSLGGFSQIWKPVKNQYQADYLIYETSIKSEADIIGYKVKSEVDCTRPGCIYLAPVWYSRGKKIYFVSSPSEADLKVYWTTNKLETNWKINK